MARRAAWLVLLISLAVFVSSGVSLVADSASADEPTPVSYKAPESVYSEPAADPKPGDCPQAPEVLVDGESAEEQYSDEIKELRFQRIATARMCEALADRSDVITKRLWWAVVELAEGRGQRSITNAKLTQLVEAICPDPCPVAVTDEGGTAELVASVDAAGESSSVALYLIAGLAVSLFIGVVLVRTVDRGT